MNLWEKYLGYHPEIISRLDLIDEASRAKFLRRMKSEKDQSNFSSTLTELSFYEFFQKQGFEVEYDKTHGKFTPDLTLKRDNNQIIAEVLKLNTTEKDTGRNHFESLLIEEIEKIEINCWIQIDFKEEYFDTSLYSYEEIANKLADWLVDNCVIGNKITFFDIFTFEIIGVYKKFTHVCVMGNVNSIDIDTRRLNADNSRFIQKIGKYDELISETSLPYLICIKIDFNAAIGEREMFWTMYGDLVFHHDYHIYHSELNGLYYTNTLTKTLSGVVLMVSDKVFYFHNFREYKLWKNAFDNLIAFQFSCETFNKLTYLRKVYK